jgi:hypothetical protein
VSGDGIVSRRVSFRYRPAIDLLDMRPKRAWYQSVSYGDVPFQSGLVQNVWYYRLFAATFRRWAKLGGNVSPYHNLRRRRLRGSLLAVKRVCLLARCGALGIFVRFA